MTTHHQDKHRQQKGFTITEVMISMAITGILMTMILQFFVDFGEVSFVSVEKNDINRDIRNVTYEMANHARQANTAILYQGISSEERDSTGDRRHAGTSGDLLVLVYQGDPDNLQTMSRPIERLIAYYRTEEQEVEGGALAGPVRKLVVDVPEDLQQEPIETILPTESELLTAEVVLELSEGLANGRLFYNFGNGSMMVNGKIIHGNRAKEVTDTYNFTISPRGQF